MSKVKPLKGGTYKGEEQHGYWWLHANGTLQYTKNCHGMNPAEFFQNWICVEWWHVRCEMDWYRMNKQADVLKNGPLQPVVA